jgi:tRNA dimethylallyltransferase
MAPGPLVVIVGPTASGKSELAMTLAQRFDGEIICADARTVYCGMDIGTAKPSEQDQAAVKHHLLDIRNPDQTYTAADFQADASAAICDILSRNKLPILAGGTGLYIDGLLFEYSFLPPTDVKTRQKLQRLSPEKLMQALDKAEISYDHVDSKNPRRLVRLLETAGAEPVRGSLRANTLIIGIEPVRAELRARILGRIEEMFRKGFLQEVRTLLSRYPADLETFRATSYGPAIEYLQGRISLGQAKARFLANDLNLAKRQRTWFKRNRAIRWIGSQDEASELVDRFLHTKQDLIQ